MPMFSKNNSKSISGDGLSVNMIGSGTELKGDIFTSGDIRVDGHVTGRISIKGKLVLGATGKVDGNIDCQQADLSGEVRGNIAASEILILKATSKIYGDISTNKIAIEPGALFSGACSMGGGVIKNIKDGQQKDLASKAI
jgi:cytoskeletal protein CcmA (bactofilin family)